MTHTMLVENDARAATASSVDVGPHDPPTFKSVLVGVGTSTGRDAIALGKMLCDGDGHMTLAHVVLVQRPIYGRFDSTGAGRNTREMLERERLAAGVSADLTGMFAPTVGWGLLELARETSADLLVVGSCRRRPISRLMRGDNTRRTLTGAARAVAVAPPGYAERPNPIHAIGVAYDGSPESATALITARLLAARHGAALRAVTVLWPTGASLSPAYRLPLGAAWWAVTLGARERGAHERLRALTGADGRVCVGPPRDELRAFSEHVDLLVVGTRGQGPLRSFLLGSTSAYLARTARCPLLVLPGGRPASVAAAGCD